MTRNVVRVLRIALCMAALGVAAVPAPAAAAGRSRALERAVGDQYAPDEVEEIARAFRAAVQGGVRERDAADLVESCVEAGFGAAQVARALSLAAQLALEDLPVESFAAKIGEGAAKGAPADRVLQAAEARALVLNRAKGAVNAAVLDGLEVRDRDGLIADVAGALEAGAGPDEVREVLDRARDEGWGEREIRRRLFP